MGRNLAGNEGTFWRERADDILKGGKERVLCSIKQKQWAYKGQSWG